MPTATVYSWFALQVWIPSYSIDRLERQQYIVNRSTLQSRTMRDLENRWLVPNKQ
jgi:hypothetical protein